METPTIINRKRYCDLVAARFRELAERFAGVNEEAKLADPLATLRLSAMAGALVWGLAERGVFTARYAAMEAYIRQRTETCGGASGRSFANRTEWFEGAGGHLRITYPEFFPPPVIEPMTVKQYADMPKPSRETIEKVIGPDFVVRCAIVCRLLAEIVEEEGEQVGRPKAIIETFPPKEVCILLGCRDQTLNHYAKLTKGVVLPGRGKRNHRYPLEDLLAICRTIQNVGGDSTVREKAEDVLRKHKTNPN